MTNAPHTPVLAEPFLALLCHHPDGHYVDATFGRGGHSRLLLQKLSPQGRLLALDRDPEAIAVGRALEQEDARFRMVHADFANLEEAMTEAGWQQADGIGFDLGVSSPQLDQAQRGFSFSHDGPLDMRMNPDDDVPLSTKLKRVKVPELTQVLRDFGDERFASRIARRIVEALAEDRLHTTAELENICFHAVPPKARHSGSHPATRTFQALRIWVNNEYGQLHDGIQAAVRMLATGGHLSVISFHSGEDRRVRDMIESEVRPCTCPPQFPICVCHRQATLKWLQKKPVRANEEELARNPRSRSALLRAAVRVAETSS
ncbi:MAG: 16S rRNA (cytosine(1402)-N(4))-methyltransferase RsmH [Mariprofundaceae bacterium]|nr:16S rRNA (cytosine(1402)-N(4))-methyltransferase RsmH [Mariprofundaceae bacterium]